MGVATLSDKKITIMINLWMKHTQLVFCRFEGRRILQK